MLTFLAVPEALTPNELAELQESGVVVAQRTDVGIGMSACGGHVFLGSGAQLREEAERARAQGKRPWAVVSTPLQVQQAIALGVDLWLRGQEAPGWVGDTTALVLIRAAAGSNWVAEGLGERAMAACLAVGAAGIVLDGPLWGCSGQWPLDGVRSGRDTALLGEAAGCRMRVLSRANPDAVALGAADEPTLRGALTSGRVRGAPQSIGMCGTWRGQPLVRSALALRHRVLQRAKRGAHPLRSDPFGTGCALVQGPMANVTERRELSEAVLSAGALPFCALGALTPADAHAVLEDFQPLSSWGAGIIGFDVMPFRDAHLEAVAATGPRPVILAGGSVALAQRVITMGLEPWLHTPDASLLQAALDAKLPAVVLEGTEAGGHVGALTSLGLWEECLEAVEAHTSDLLLVLAGGIGDATSAAMAGAMASTAHSRGTRVALQAGTAFFFSHEIVEAAQIPLTYQEAALSAQRTELVGATVNLPLRCVPNDYTDEARHLERTWAEEGGSRHSRRERMEMHNLGRARIAAKGIERHPDWGQPNVPHYRAVNTATQRAHGALTMGQGATVRNRLRSVAEIVRELTVDASEILEGRVSERVERVARGGPSTRKAVASTAGSRSDRPEPIAVVGMGCVLPGANNIEAFWDLLLRGTDAIGPIPAERWNDARYAGSGRSQSTSRLAGVVTDFVFDPLAFRIPPRIVPAIDRAQQLALVAAKQAVEAAGWERTGAIDRRRAAVILGNSMGGEHAKSLAVRIRFREVMHALSADPLTAGFSDEALDALEERIEERIAKQLPPVDVESMAGLLGNVIAGRVASWLDWMGGNLTVDAACAASLGSIAVAADWLRNGRVDAVLAGGVDADMSPETYVGFSRTHALSATGSSPFSSDADGFVMGEGAAVLALMRLSDATARDVPVWGVLHGIGQASDGRSKGITAPRAEGQELAMARAYAEAGFGPDQVGALEAHGTGTALGDRTEASALARRFLGTGPVWLGSVKSNIGHLKGAAGAAGVVKAVLTALTGIVPPTLHAGPVAQELRGAGLQLPRRPSPLSRPMVGVSAFGFGGTDFHVLVGPPTGRRPTCMVPPVTASRWSDDVAPLVLCFAAGSLKGLVERVAQDLPCTLDTPGEHRLAVCVRGSRAAAIARAATWLRTSPVHGAQLGREATYGRGAAEDVVLMFPGQGAQKVGAIHAATQCLPGSLAVGALGEPAGAALVDWESQDGALAIHLALFASGIGWAATLADVALPVAATVGHSLGAFASLVAAGRLDVQEALELVVARGQALEDCPVGAMLAVQLCAADARAAATSFGLSLAAINGPTSTVLAGDLQAIEAAAHGLAAARPTRVPVPRAYHSPSVQPAADRLRPIAERCGWRAGTPVWSTRTAAPFADNLAEDLALAIVEPVRFDDTVLAMLDAGHRVFVECGPGSILCRLIRERGGVAIPLDARAGGHPEAAASLWALGHPQLLKHAPGTVLRRGLPAVAKWSWPRPTGTEVEAPRRRRREPESLTVAVETPTVPRGGAHDAVVAAICEVTGYPADFVSGSADLEADLGVDSIRKMEVLGHLEKRLQIRATEADHARLAQVDVLGLVAWVEEAQARGDSPVLEQVASQEGVWFTVPVVIRSVQPPVVVPSEPASAVLSWLQTYTPSGSLRSDDPVTQALVDGWCSSAAREGAPVTPPGVGLRIVEPVHVRFPHKPVILATGGLTGIVRPCLEALGDLEPTIIVLGRRAVEPPAGWHYVVCDLTDPSSVSAALGGVVAQFGAIDVVVHGAGALADGAFTSATHADHARVLGPKLDGAMHLSEAISTNQANPPSLWVNFGSVVAWAGNPHQSLYAAANRALGALPVAANRVLTIGWTAWSEVGMASDPALQRLLTSRGLSSLSPANGAAAFARLVHSPLAGNVLVWAQRPDGAIDVPVPLEARIDWSLDGARYRIRLSPTDPALADHVVAGRPLVPAAWWAASMLAAVNDRFGPQSRTLADFKIHAPTFVSAPRDDVVLDVTGSANAARLRVLAGETLLASATSRPMQIPRTQTAPLKLGSNDNPPRYQPDKLFHGHAWQLLLATRTTVDSAVADVRVANGLPRSAEIVDAAYQLLCTWADDTHGFLALPIGATAWSWFGEADGHLQLQATPRLEGHHVVADVAALNAEGSIVLQGHGVTLQRATGGVNE